MLYGSCVDNKIGQIDEMEGLERNGLKRVGLERNTKDYRGRESEGLKGLFFVSAKPNQ